MHEISPFEIMGRKFLEEEKTGYLVPSPPSSANASLEVAEPSSFDGTLIIILAGFVVSLLCAMAVSRLVRCACAWIGEMTGINFSPVAVAVTSTAQTGISNGGNNTCVKKFSVNTMPSVVYCREMESRGTDCAICLAEFVEGEKLRIVAVCNHRFHMECIDKWVVHNPSCPSCRQSLVQ